MLIQNKYTCENCKKPGIDILELYTGNLCKECYAIEYEKMTPEQQKPNFIGTIKASALCKSMGISFTQL